MIIEQVKKIVAEAAQALPGAEVLAPFVAYGSDGMGVQIKMAQLRGGFQQCELVASFVIPKNELDDDEKVRDRADAAVIAIQHDVQIVIRPVDNIQVTA